MSISVIDRWIIVSQEYFSEEIYGEELLEKFTQDVILSPKDFQNFFDNVIKGRFHQHFESHFFYMPENIIEDQLEGYGKYEGCVRICWNNFDDQEHIGLVRLDKFCFYVKLAAIFHAKHVDPDFDPWEDFQKLDEMQNRYFPNVEV